MKGIIPVGAGFGSRERQVHIAINRITGGYVSGLHHVPSVDKRQPWLPEGILPTTAFFMGNTIVDADVRKSPFPKMCVASGEISVVT